MMTEIVPSVVYSGRARHRPLNWFLYGCRASLLKLVQFPRRIMALCLVLPFPDPAGVQVGNISSLTEKNHEGIGVQATRCGVLDRALCRNNEGASASTKTVLQKVPRAPGKRS